MLGKKKAGSGRNTKRTRAGLKGREGKPKQRQSGATELAALPAMRVRRIKIADIIVTQPRKLKQSDVLAKAESMATIGLKTPITVRQIKGRITLIAGEERLEAAKLLGWEEIDAAFFKGGKISSRMWHHLENLDHSDKFTPLEKAERLADVVKLKARLISRQNVAKKRGRPTGMVTRVQSTLPIKGKTAKARARTIQRALQVARLPEKVKTEAKARGLDKKQTALMEIAKQKTQEAQLQKIAEIGKRKSQQQAKRNRVKKGKAKADLAEEKKPAQKHPDEVIFAELKSETLPNFRRTWAEAPTKVQRRYLREVLNWEGGKPASKSD